jgi:capsular polysaccharide biosynthesis protein
MAENAVTSGRNAQMVIIDPAYKPTHPAKPSRSLLAGAGLGISIVLALALALGCALMDDRLYDRTDVERMELVSMLGVVPRGGAKARKGAGRG